jgi:hypothetical protein
MSWPRELRRVYFWEHMYPVLNDVKTAAYENLIKLSRETLTFTSQTTVACLSQKPSEGKVSIDYTFSYTFKKKMLKYASCLSQLIDSVNVTVLFKLKKLCDTEWWETCNCVIDGFPVKKKQVSTSYIKVLLEFSLDILKKNIRKLSLKTWSAADIRARGLSNMR